MFSLIETLATVHSHAAETLSNADQWFRDVAELLPQSVWTASADGTKTFCSHQYLEYTGAVTAEIMNEAWASFIHPEDRAAVSELWSRSLATGAPYLAEYRLRRFDGSYRYFRASALPVRDQLGNTTQWLGISEDIHEEKLAERDREIEAKLAAVRGLAASIAHEINNPLEGVINALYLALQDRQLDHSTRRYLDTAEHELQRVARIATHSLRFHQQPNPPAVVDLDILIRSVLSTFDLRLAARCIQVVCNCSPECTLVCSSDDLRQVLGTLLQNSIDALPQAGRLSIRIRKTHSAADPASRGMRITVADSGHGISAHHRPRIFEPFFSTRDATRTGLALWIAEQIVRKHNGRITFRSCTREPHQGSTFSVFLPLS